MPRTSTDRQNEGKQFPNASSSYPQNLLKSRNKPLWHGYSFPIPLPEGGFRRSFPAIIFSRNSPPTLQSLKNTCTQLEATRNTTTFPTGISSPLPKNLEKPDLGQPWEQRDTKFPATFQRCQGKPSAARWDDPDFPAPCCPFPALRSREAPPAPSFPNFLWREAKRSRNSTKSKRGHGGEKPGLNLWKLVLKP